jgi:hypothetical protein
LVPPSESEGAATTGPTVRRADARASGVIRGRSPSTTARASDPITCSSTWCRAARSPGSSSATGLARRRAETSSTASSGDTTHVCHPGWAMHASRRSSSMARVRAARSSGWRMAESRPLARSRDFTGTAITRMGEPW